MTEARCPECGRLAAAGDRFCSRCGTALQHGARSPQTPDARASLEEMFAHLRSGEQRLATVLMADVTGFSELAAQAEPEWLFNIINELMTELAECLVGHGAHIDNYVGDEVVALFGVPMAQERSAERALLAALAMQDRMRALNDEGRFGGVRLEMHTGINIGRVMVGPIGHVGYTDYTVIGDSVNVAKRLEDEAPPGETFVSRAVRDAVGAAFEFEPAARLRIAGGEREIEAFRLVGADQAQLSQRHVLLERPASAARRSELQRLQGYAEAVRGGAGLAVAVIGPPGIGKTHLITDWRESASASGFRVVSTTCHACGTYFPLLPLADVAARIIGLQVRGWPPAVVGDVHGALEAVAISGADRDLVRQLLSLVVEAPEQGPDDLPGRLAAALSELTRALAGTRPQHTARRHGGAPEATSGVHLVRIRTGAGDGTASQVIYHCTSTGRLWRSRSCKRGRGPRALLVIGLTGVLAPGYRQNPNFSAGDHLLRHRPAA
ncbi:MAG: adenylate/guanylate cyclase domain-containing protein [Armatimonadota bacterium]|nr:adenylate/guanylate cyclase domain-containing protein [Armatimonadota bacterium]